MRICVCSRAVEGTAKVTGAPRLSRPLLCFMTSTLLLTSPHALAADLPATFKVLNSYSQPPFVQRDESGSGLAKTLVGLIQEEAELTSALALETVPRKRLELNLGRSDFQGLALFLAPEFLSKGAHGGQWSVPVMLDENVLVSLRPLHASSLDDLAGKKFGGISGHVYRMLGPHVEAGRVTREDAVDHVSNLKKLCLGRVDFVVMSRSELAGSGELAACEQPFAWSPFPEPQVIVRRVLVRTPNARLSHRLLAATQRVACSQAWRAALKRYQLSVVGCATRALD